MPTEEILAEYRFSGFSVDVRRRKIISPEGELINLSSRAFDTLLVLLENHGNTLSKAELMQQVWSSAVVEDNNLNQAIFSLRRALGDSRNNSRFILTLPGRGYCFVAPVEVRWTHQDGDNTTVFPLSGIKPRWWLACTAILSHPATVTLTLLVALAVGTLISMGNREQSIAAGTMAVDAMTGSGPVPDIIENSIAVLPFTAIESDTDKDLFVLGLHIEVINRLSRIRGLNVISRNSVLSLVESGMPMNELAAFLKVESFLSGTVLFSGGQARISLQMYDAASGISHWSRTYEVSKDLAEMFSVQNNIALDVASALEAEIRGHEQNHLTHIPTTSVDAYRYYLSAQIAHYKQDFLNEWKWSQDAIALDPDYYDAHATFSLVNTILVTSPIPGMTKQDHFEMALASADRLIELQPGNSKGHALKASALSTNRDWEGVFRIVDTLNALNAPMADMNYLAIVLLCSGDFDQAIEIYRESLQTEPLNLYARGLLMVALELAGRREEARREYDLGEEFSPVWWGDTVNMFLALGRNEPLEGIDEITMVSEDIKALMHNAHDLEKLKAGLAGFRETGNHNTAESVHLAALAAYSGDQELAVEFLEDALRNNWSALYWTWLPVFDEARKLPRYKALLQESGIVSHWEKSGWPKVCQPVNESFACEWSAYPGS